MTGPLDSAMVGLVVAEPVVVLRLDVTVSGGTGVAGTIPSGLVLRLLDLRTLPTGPLVPQEASDASGFEWMVVLEWNRPLTGRFVVEASTDLQEWIQLPLEPLPSASGVVRVQSRVPSVLATFFRLRQAPK
jgi:hypothetical protein